MNHCQKLIPMCQRLGSRALIPTRTFFSRRGWGPWQNMWEKHLEDMDRQFARLEREMNSAFRDLGLPGNRRGRLFFEPAGRTNNRGFPTIETGIEPATEAGKPGKYCIRIDVGEGFNPENVKVNLKDRQLTIHAKLEKTSEDGRLYQEVTRSFTLPENINPEEVKSLLTPDGVLTIEAPLPEIEAPKPKEIPISIESKPKN